MNPGTSPLDAVADFNLREASGEALLLGAPGD